MDKQLLFQFLDARGLGVFSSLGPMGAPQSALVGIAITPELEIVSTRWRSRASSQILPVIRELHS
jgi:hypothetical protein